MKEVIIGFDEPRLYVAMVLTAGFYFALLWFAKKLSSHQVDKLTVSLGISFLLLTAAIHPILIYSDHLEWSAHKALPFHLCAFNFLLTGINCFLRKVWIWEIATFWGIIGGFHSLLTPQLTMGDEPFFMFFYYYQHGALFFMPLYFWVLYGFRFRTNSWVRVFFITNAYAVVIFLIDWMLNRVFPGKYVANYFYLWEPPKANNPLIIGSWPWYLIPLQFALVAHLIVINAFFRLKERHKPWWK